MNAAYDATPPGIRSGCRQCPYLLHSLLASDLLFCEPIAMETVRNASRQMNLTLDSCHCLCIQDPELTLRILSALAVLVKLAFIEHVEDEIAIIFIESGVLVGC